MRHSPLRIFIAAFILLILQVSSAHALEYYKNFDVIIKINEDSSINVTENITANVENINIKRGIKRAFPVEYTNEEGNSVYVGFDVIDVLLDGRKVNWRVDSDGRYKVVTIGDKDIIISPGLHTFTINYLSDRQLGFYEKYDELYWNVTGTQNTFPIASASCKVALPGKDFGEGFNSIEWYVGAYGEKGDKSDAKLGIKGKVSTTKTLQSGENLSVVYTWPKGLVTPPPPPVPEDRGKQAAVGAGTFFLMGCWLFYARKKWGTDSAQRAVIPIFSPPNGESPAYMRFARDLMADNTSFTAAILNLAVKGSLSIEETEGESTLFGRRKSTYALHRLKEENRQLRPEEDALMMKIFPGTADTLQLHSENNTRISAAMSSLDRNLKKYRREFYRANTGVIAAGVIIYLLGVTALYPFSGDYFEENALFCLFIGGAVLLSSLFVRTKTANTTWQKLKSFIFKMLPSLAVITFFIYMFTSDWKELPLVYIFFAAAAMILFAAKPLIASRTAKGVTALSDAEGLALYMKTAEKERLEMFNPPEETPELFEKLMPYALALDTAETWGNRFEKILEKAQYQPTWYVGPNPYIFMYAGGLNSFSSDISNSITSSLPSQTTLSAPGSGSGFGGGGFSGGGGGGGGSSGW